MKELEINNSIFESIKNIDEDGNEYWSARELTLVLGYKEWRYFVIAIEKSQIGCLESKNNVGSDFGVSNKIVKAGATSKPVQVEHILLFKQEKWNYQKKTITF